MDDRLLRTTLTVNAGISAVWGLAAATGAGVLAEPLGLPAPAMIVAGVVTLVAAGLFWRFRSRDRLRPVEGWVATIGDLVFGTALVVAAVATPDVTGLGRWVVAISGLAVLDLAVIEWVGVRRLARPSPQPAGLAA